MVIHSHYIWSDNLFFPLVFFLNSLIEKNNQIGNLSSDLVCWSTFKYAEEGITFYQVIICLVIFGHLLLSHNQEDLTIFAQQDSSNLGCIWKFVAFSPYSFHINRVIFFIFISTERKDSGPKIQDCCSSGVHIFIRISINPLCVCLQSSSCTRMIKSCAKEASMSWQCDVFVLTGLQQQ